MAGHAAAVSAADAVAGPACTRRPLQPLSLRRLQALTQTLTTPPDGVLLHDVVRGLCERWRTAVSDGEQAADWCMAENLAYATLLEDGHSVRLSGMDVGRGTFMHRHAVWHSQATQPAERSPYVPLQHLAPHQGGFDVVNSPLSEEAALGFEYGYSVQTRTRLTLWEAQFGDFVNGAQVFIDQYIASGEYKWGCRSALAMLLPHGHEGVGPEHSSGFLGRFLQLCADGNLRVVMPSTSGQWFHLLREQAALTEPKPLIVMSPKAELLGHARSHARVRDLVEGAFMPVLPDTATRDPDAVTRAVLCSGKFFYELLAQREREGRADVALIRVEQLYPFPQHALKAALERFPNLAEIVWAQEEDANQGAWRSVRDALEGSVPKRSRLAAVCRRLRRRGRMRRCVRIRPSSAVWLRRRSRRCLDRRGVGTPGCGYRIRVETLPAARTCARALPVQRQRPKEKGAEAPLMRRQPFTAASLTFFSARTFTRTVAGLASNHCSRPVNGFLPKRRLVAGTFTDVTLNRPGSVNSPAPFLCRAPRMVCSRC